MANPSSSATHRPIDPTLAQAFAPLTRAASAFEQEVASLPPRMMDEVSKRVRVVYQRIQETDPTGVYNPVTIMQAATTEVIQDLGIAQRFNDLFAAEKPVTELLKVYDQFSDRAKFKVKQAVKEEMHLDIIAVIKSRKLQPIDAAISAVFKDMAPKAKPEKADHKGDDDFSDDVIASHNNFAREDFRDDRFSAFLKGSTAVHSGSMSSTTAAMMGATSSTGASQLVGVTASAPKKVTAEVAVIASGTSGAGRTGAAGTGRAFDVTQTGQGLQFGTTVSKQPNYEF